METYREKLKVQNVCLTLGIAALLAVQVLSWLQLVEPAVKDSRWASGWNGFIAGAGASMTAFMVVGLVMNLRALSNEKLLKKQRAKENDERKALITQRAQSMGARCFMLGMLPVVVICGYFSITVSLTCLACDLALCLITVGGKLFWARRL